MESSPPRRWVDPHLTSLDQLEPSPSIDFQPLDPSVRYLWFFSRLIFWGMMGALVVILGLTGLFTRGDLMPYPQLVLGLLAILGPLHLFWPFISYKYWGFAIRENDFLIKSGVLWKRVSTVPFARIQHVDSHSGPIERGLGLATLIIHTAGASAGSLGVPGLEIEHAEALRDYLSKVGHTHANI